MLSHQGDVVAARIEAELPQRLFRLTTEDGTTITAGISTELRRLGLVLRPGMNVDVRLAELDATRGTILGLTRSNATRRSQS